MKSSYVYYFLLVVLVLFLFGLHFLQRGPMFHYIHTFILFKHAEFLFKSSRDEMFTRLFFSFSSRDEISSR